MPNDENTQTTQQNGNPVVNSNVSTNPGNSDDFDFSFDSDFGSSVPNDQNQTSGQGRTGMFLTPDEEAEKEELKNSGQSVSAGQESSPDVDPALSANNGSYFPNVNVNNNVSTNDNTEVNEDNIGNVSFDQGNDSQNDKFDEKIENLISFDEDSSVADTNTDDSDTDSLNTDDSNIGTNEVVSENKDEIVDSGADSMENQSLNNDETTVQNVNLESTDVPENAVIPETTEDVGKTEEVESVNSGDNSQNDDWLQQEDKKVEETFGGENTESQEIQVNESPADVAQNVEDVINNTTSEEENNLGKNDVVADNNIGNSDTSLPDGLGQPIDSQAVEPNYVPNEADFSAMSNLLNSSNAGQVDLRNVNTGADDISENNSGLSEDMSTSDSSISDLSKDQGNGLDVNVGNPVQDAVDTMQDSVNTVEDTANTDNMQNETSDNQSIDLNSIGALGSESLNVTDTQGMPVDVMVDQEIQNMHVQPQNTDQASNVGVDDNTNQAQSQNIETQGQSVRKRQQSGLVVLGIFGVIILLGALGYFIVAKMFPDKFNTKNLFGGNNVVEYLSGDESTGDVENDNMDNLYDDGQGDQNDMGVIGNDGELVEKGDQNDMGVIGNDGELVENGSELQSNNDMTQDREDIDPNSLAGLLSSDETGSESNNSLDGDVNIENNGLNDEGLVSVDNEIVSGEELDLFGEIDNILSNEKSDSDRLNDYIEQGNYYKELGESNGNKKMKIYGEYIIATATEELSKLENGEEIDNTIFGKLDEILESLKEYELNNK